MFTQQSPAIAEALELPAGTQQTQALLQAFANCVQGLRTNGPASFNSAAGRIPPRGGVISAPLGVGAPVTRQARTGVNLTDYYYGHGDRSNGYNNGNWSGPTRGPPVVNQFYAGPVHLLFGGDTAYGDTYQNNVENNVYNAGSNYLSYNSYGGSGGPNGGGGGANSLNLSDWYSNQFSDNSYNDFTTTLNTTQNTYAQTVNNFQGDSYFDSSIHQGDVHNLKNVYNQGDVYHNGKTYLNPLNTFFVTNLSTLNLRQFITEVVNKTTQGQKPPPAKFLGSQGTIRFTVKEYSFDADTCALVATNKTVEASFTPSGDVTYAG